MKYLSPDFYDKFKCIGGECPSTCCAGNWQILIDDRTKKEYDSVTGEFGQTLKENIVTVDSSQFAFRLTKDGRCPFLDAENLCEIYQKLGPEHLCYTCQCYPRIVCRYGDVLFRTLTLSCPEVSRILLNRTDPISFAFSEVSSGKKDEPSTDRDWFNTLMSCFTFNIDLLQNRNYPLSARLRVLLIFNFTLQSLLDANKDTAPLIRTYADQNYLNGQLSSFSSLSPNFASMFAAFLLFDRDTSSIRDHWINSSFAEQIQKFITAYDSGEDSLHLTESFRSLTDAEHDIQYEHFCVLFLFRNYFNAYTDEKPFDKVEELVYALLLARGYALPFCSKEGGISVADQITLFASLSRSLNHNSNKRQILKTYYEKDGQADINLLLTLI